MNKSPVWYDAPNPHIDCFCINWDNDVVCLNKEEAKDLIVRLNEFIR